MRVPKRVLLAAAAALAASAALAPGSGGAATSVTCPASAAAASTSAGPVQWEFSVLGAPSAGAAGVTSSYTRGNGTWNAGEATGTICANDKGGAGVGHRDLVLKVAGSSLLSPRITRYGLLGVGIVLPVTVSASDDSACATGAHGTVTLFASYFSVHRDSIALHFAGACGANHDHTFTGTLVKVLIARNGAQVNST